MKARFNRSKEFNSKLAAYSATAKAAALAAPAAALLTGPAAHAALMNITGPSVDLNLPLNGGPQQVLFTVGPFPGLLLSGRRDVGGSGSSGQLYLEGQVARSGYPSVRVSRLGYGDTINGKNFNFGGVPLAFVLRSSHGTVFDRGNFLPPPNGAVTGYIAFKTFSSVAGTNYYGWLRVKVQGDSRGLPEEFSFVDKNGDGIFGAYGLKSDNITAGETAPTSVPDAGSTAMLTGLALLALGAFGVHETRRRRAANA